jgi:oxamate amidohydrolase
MLNTPRATRGMVVAPHHLAAEAGLAVLREGGNAIEAMVAASAVAMVVYPHMTGLGGDGFMLIAPPAGTPLAIEACGRAAAAADLAFYKRQGLERIPARGPLAAITVAGTVSGWQAALELSARMGGRLPLARLLADAVFYAREGYAVSGTQAENTAAKLDELKDVPGFAPLFLARGAAPPAGRRFKNPALAESLARLAAAGLDDFYRGALARRIAGDLARGGSPLTAADLAAQKAILVPPLALKLGSAVLYNLPPPSQGLASLVILGIFERLGIAEAEGFAHVHGMVEATKEAFRIRDEHLTDPDHMRGRAEDFLADTALAEMARRIDPARAGAWTLNPAPGDTVWMGAADARGLVVSFIHSIYWEFGSGVVLGESGIVWQNRGMAFSLTPGSLHQLLPHRRPFHTNNPALARFDDGRVMAYGAMGGDGQPQSQAAVFSRYGLFGRPLQEAVTAPRWVLGRTWGAGRTGLRLEGRFEPATVAALERAGHEVEVLAPFSSVMGHAGAVVRHQDGMIDGAADPRSDGAAAGF